MGCGRHSGNAPPAVKEPVVLPKEKLSDDPRKPSLNARPVDDNDQSDRANKAKDLGEPPPFAGTSSNGQRDRASRIKELLSEPGELMPIPADAVAEGKQDHTGGVQVAPESLSDPEVTPEKFAAKVEPKDDDLPQIKTSQDSMAFDDCILQGAPEVPSTVRPRMSHTANKTYSLPPPLMVRQPESSSTPVAPKERHSQRGVPLPPTATQQERHSQRGVPLPPTATQQERHSQRGVPLPPTATQQERHSQRGVPLPPTATQQDARPMWQRMPVTTSTLPVSMPVPNSENKVHTLPAFGGRTGSANGSEDVFNAASVINSRRTDDLRSVKSGGASPGNSNSGSHSTFSVSKLMGPKGDGSEKGRPGTPPSPADVSAGNSEISERVLDVASSTGNSGVMLQDNASEWSVPIEEAEKRGGQDVLSYFLG